MNVVEQVRSPITASVVAFRFPVLVSVSRFVWTGMTLIVVAVLLTAQRDVTDAFSVYGDLFGDEARQAALGRGFACRETGLPEQPQASYACAHPDPDSPFSRVYLRLTGNRADEIRFSLREDTLTFGDLALLWGRPAIQVYCETVVASWPGHQIRSLFATPSNGRLSYFSPVLSVAFMRGGPTHLEQALRNDALHGCRALSRPI